jgi:hypothetical protein
MPAGSREVGQPGFITRDLGPNGREVLFTEDAVKDANFSPPPLTNYESLGQDQRWRPDAYVNREFLPNSAAAESIRAVVFQY